MLLMVGNGTETALGEKHTKQKMRLQMKRPQKEIFTHFTHNRKYFLEK